MKECGFLHGEKRNACLIFESQINNIKMKLLLWNKTHCTINILVYWKRTFAIQWKKVASVLSINKHVNPYSWKGHAEAISKYSRKRMNINSNLEAHNTKLCLCKTGQLIKDQNILISAGPNDSSNTQGSCWWKLWAD